MPTPATLALLDAYWATQYGVLASFWQQPGGVTVAPRAGDAAYEALFVFATEAACVVQAPFALKTEARRLVDGRSRAVLLAPDYWVRALGDRLARLVGPAWLGYADATDFVDPGESAARQLEAADDAALAQLQAAVGPTAWEHAGIACDNMRRYGIYAEGQLVAAGMIEVWGEHLGHMGIVAHPAFRGRGLARAVVACATRAGLREGLVLQYRTLGSNVPSLCIADGLGFKPYATTLAVRLASADF